MVDNGRLAARHGGVMVPEGIELPPPPPRRVHLDDILPATFEQFWYEQGVWADQQFGSQRGPEAARASLLHLQKEVEEALAEPGDRIEYADMMHLIFDAARRIGLSMEDLIDACFEKLAINKKRRWPPRIPGVPTEHIRESNR